LPTSSSKNDDEKLSVSSVVNRAEVLTKGVDAGKSPEIVRERQPV
jgi:hypothetical protein